MISHIIVGIFVALAFSTMVTGIIIQHCGIKKIPIIIGIIISLVISSIVPISYIKSDDEWNNGYCAECNEPWTFVNGAYKRYSGQVYYYKCDKCGKVIEEQELR
ncbi:MAG TPA: hypothetical protein DDW20_03595 [Firmicutes bacterium]|nr:hypothetical protein [Bacillota bacterium]